MLKKFAAFLCLLLVVAADMAIASQSTVNFATNDPIVDLGKSLSLYHAPSSTVADGSVWYMLTATNDSVRPATRILLAEQPVGASVSFFPRRARPSIRQIASSDAEVTIEPARSYGRHAFRVVVPPASSAALAIRIADADPRPSVEAWTEPALIAHSRQLAIFFAAVAGLMAAALAITAGLAFMTSHAAPRWAAITIAMIFLALLASSGVFDAGWFTAVGGPYGFSIMIVGFCLVAGLRLANIIAPVPDLWPGAKTWWKWALIALAALSIFSFIGIPGAMLLTEIAVVMGSGAITGYFVHRGRLGSGPARVIAPSAAVFSLVATAAAITALDGFHDNPSTSAIVGGFAAAGTVLLALAIAAGEGIAVLQVLGAPKAGGVVPSNIDQTKASALRAIGASHQGVFELGFRDDVVRLSAEAGALIGLKASAEMPHVDWIARVHPDDRSVYQDAMSDYRGHVDLAFRIELRVHSESGLYPWFELRATMLGGRARAERCLGLLADITSRKNIETAQPEVLPNNIVPRPGSRAAMIAELDRAREVMAASQMVFVLLDVDRFKMIHANLGDEGGDEVLSTLNQRLANRFGDRARIFRAGGDSFALLFETGVPNELGMAIMEACDGPIAYNGRSVFASVSLGIVHGRDAKDAQAFLDNADVALSQAKRIGGSRAVVYSWDAQIQPPNDPVALESDLRRALAANEFEVFYQPIVELDEGSVAGFEALLRWRHPAKGLIAPGEFIAHCEETGLIVSIGRSVLDRAAQDLARWQRFFPLDPALFASVNLSRRQLHDDGLKDFLADLLSRSGLAKGSLKIEVTESAAGSQSGANDVLTDIQSLGVGLAMDDFGTGLSALSELKDLPFDTIKIDQSFLASKADEKSEGAVILASIVKLAKDLGRLVVAEGVETERDAEWLREQGCHYAQGFYFSVPLTSEEVLKFVAQHYRTSAQTTSGATGVSRKT